MGGRGTARGALRLAAAFAVLGAFAAPGASAAGDPPPIATERDKVNYAIGVNIVSNLRAQGIDVDLDLVVRGMRDEHAGKLALSAEEIRIGIQKYQTAVRQKRSAPGRAK